MSDRPREEARGPSLQDAAADIRGAADRVGTQASRTGATIGREAASVAGEARAQGEAIADAARQRATEAAEQGKDAVADRAHGVAEAVRHVADDLEDTSPEIARHVRAAAESVDHLSTSLRERNLGDLLDGVERFARRQPTAFFGAAAVAGFALARFAKSSAEDRIGRTHRAPTHRAPMGGAGAPGWTPDDGADRDGDVRPRPATMSAASLGGAAAHRPGDAAPGSMPGDERPVPPAPPAGSAA